MFRYRLLTALVGIPIILAFLYFYQGNFFYLLILIITMAALFEYYRLYRNRNYRPLPVLLFLGGVILVVASNWGKIRGLIAAYLILVAIILTFVWILNKSTFMPIFLATSLGIFYIAFMLSHLILLKDINPSWVLAVLLGTWVTDISAYSVGSLVGKTKLAPAISPNKTLEGALVAVLICGFVFITFSFLVKTLWWQRLLFGLILGFFTVVGDLVESKIKRTFNVKDTGKIIPGHGGFLDRFDSLLLTGTIAFYLVIIFF